MKLISFGKTDQGKMRTNNEDAFLENDHLGLYAVADGIGGNEGGEVASRLAVEALSSMLSEQLGVSRSSAAFHDSSEADQHSALMRGAVAFANTTIIRAAAQDPALAGMGTTVTAVLLRPRASIFAHVGDSRVYLLHHGMLTQLTDDHSLVAEQVRAGLITPEQARMSTYRHVISRSVGIHPHVLVDLGIFEVEKNDVLLLCTDGLTEMVRDDDIARILGSGNPSASAESLIRLANDNGGVDNITVVVVSIEDV
jgi:serine/threonine protein phosphatase PrpC